MYRGCVAVTVVAVAVCVFAGGVFAGPKGVIVVRPLAENISITIDGEFEDWPLTDFDEPSTQPLFPEGQESEGTDARGDYVIYDPDRAGFFNFERGAAEDDENLDFEASTYFAYDSDFLYVLSVFIDDELTPYRDESWYGSQPYQNDGLEFFFDSKNDSVDDCISDLSFPSIDDEEPNLDDFQVGTGINEYFDPVLPGGIGATQGIIRSGDRDLLGSGDFADGTYQEALEAAEGPDIAAMMYADLRAVGAPNPAIAQNPDLTFSGYTIELRIPFGVVEGFTPDHDIGFTVFWRDWDDFNGSTGQFIDWAQSTTAGGCLTEEAMLTDIFYAPNWGALEFDTANPLGAVAVDNWPLR